MRQLYCNGGCTWAGSSSCDQADADILCQLRNDDPAATALSYTSTTAQGFEGFPCSPLGLGTPFSGPVEDRVAASLPFDITFQDSSILANHGAGAIVLDPVCSSQCGDGVLDAGEEVDPPVSQFANLTVDPQTCRYDLTAVPQLYCNGTCTYDDPTNGCQQQDADIFCQLKMDNPLSTATSFSTATALTTHGFPCARHGYGTAFSADLTPRLASPLSFALTYQDASIRGNHGGGTVINTTSCTNP